MVDFAATCLHESAHAAACIWLRGVERPIECVRVDSPEVDVAGKMTSSLKGEIGPEDLIINLLGWWVDDDCPRQWPPAWPVDEDELDGVGKLVRILKLDEEQYDALIEVAEDLLREPAFRRLMNLIARALARAPVLDAESVEMLREATDTPLAKGATT